MHLMNSARDIPVVAQAFHRKCVSKLFAERGNDETQPLTHFILTLNDGYDFLHKKFDNERFFSRRKS